MLTFQYWWKSPVIETIKQTYFSREDLIRIMTNQDGGAHVSEKLDSEFAAFKKDNFGIGAEYQIGSEPLIEDFSKELKPVQNNPAAASARQIAFELALTLHRYIDTLPEDHPLRVQRKPMYEFKRALRPNALPFSRVMLVTGGTTVPTSTASPARSIPHDVYAGPRSQLRGTYSFDKPRILNEQAQVILQRQFRQLGSV